MITLHQVLSPEIFAILLSIVRQIIIFHPCLLYQRKNETLTKGEPFFKLIKSSNQRK